MFRRNRISGFAKFVLAALLFAQAALAIAGCELGQRSAARAIASIGEVSCPEHGEPGVLNGNANLCLVHCTSEAQNVDSTGSALQPFSPVAVLTVPLGPEACRVTARRPAAASFAFAAPPVRILTHNLRI